MQATPAKQSELTYRGLILGGLITLVFTAANVYLGLKVGLTFASSIPAAVISMAVLRLFRGATIAENNIVQTVASAAGTLSSIIFVLPGLVMIGWWTGFPYWQSLGVCVIGGVLGVLYTVPLRRALVTDSDLPYPEGVAAAEVLRVGAGAVTGDDPKAKRENEQGLLTVVVGSVVSAGFAAIVAAKVFAAELDVFGRIGNAATGLGVAYSLALLGAGHLIGLTVGIAMVGGLMIAWGIATPILTSLHPHAGDAATFANDVWRHQVRFIGAGTIGISGIWTLFKLAAPVTRGVTSALATASKRKTGGIASLPRTEQDIPINIVAIGGLALLVPLAAMLWLFLNGTALAPLAIPLVLDAVIYVVIAGFLVATACGYMAGLIGSSNSPVSGLAILTVIGASLLLVVLVHSPSGDAAKALVAYALFVTAVVLCVATIANDNLQDLKTGQLVDATPWRQQVALIVGVGFGAAIIPPILDLLNRAYGFAGAPKSALATVAAPLPAPQATLISALARGVIEGTVPWNLIGIGVLAGIAIIAVDEILGKTTGKHFPPLAVGIGIYLPASTTTPVVIGAICGWAYDRYAARTKDPAATKGLGVLLASGLIVGESLFGVALAALIVATSKAEPLAIVGDGFENAGNWLGTLGFALAVAGLYAWIVRLRKTTTVDR